MIIRSIKWIVVVKFVWLSANLTGWLMGLGSCMTEPGCYLANNGFLPILLLLSFPGSLIFFIANEILIETGFVFDTTAAMYYTFLSLGTITIGYLQWFHVLPAVFGKQDVTVLSLNQPITPSAVEQEMPSKPCKPTQLKAPLVLPFDNAGRTPLERAIYRRSRHRLTDSS